MKKIFLIILLVLFYPFSVWADTHTAASCSYADVSAAITAASAGDTVSVPAGSATWNSRLEITNGISLIGAGTANTIITGNYTHTGYESSDATYYLIAYKPDATNRTNDTPFRISGFYLDGGNKANILTIHNVSTTPISNVRVDHCYFINPYHEAIAPIGHVFGVVDSCTFDTNGKTDDFLDYWGLSDSGWENLTFTYGTYQNWYYEDNTFLTYNGWLGDNWDCTDSGRYAARFNTITQTGTSYCSPVFDAHGSSEYTASTMGIEVYGNSITGSNGKYLVQQRGGMALVFDNVMQYSGTGTGLIQVGDYANSCADTGCDNDWDHPVSSDGEHQYPNRSYYWNNSVTNPSNEKKWGIICQGDYSNGGGGNFNCPVMNPPNRVVPQAEAEFWGQYLQTGNPNTVEAFTGARGVGRGTKAAMLALETCTIGVGYWVTDEGSWRGGYPGTSGQLYTCTTASPAAWTLYYTPYAYPHPLRGEGTTPPSATGCTIKSTSGNKIRTGGGGVQLRLQ